MNDSQYNLMADELLLAVEEAIDDCDVDIDYESAGGLLTLMFTTGEHRGSKIIINKQAPLHEIWVATKFNGHHFTYQSEQWIDKRGGGEFWQFLSQAVSLQAGQDITLSEQ
ncbi:iron donor protein CyaY [Thalassotalea ponticola]|uniref:iron donor protein CyaY n=1 Tax=Thalassotalea ponticola TaxID=1523392 RepID=UPI0025B38E49|nr:iron donor protein CyaY [Thalassotalea ponticola]MDN3652776.1 iron donor protein CyaY [Thalassotalea ponticola]